MKELVIISGKGGTGKTSICASLAVLSGGCVVADCDVDAADLHLVLSPKVQRREPFTAGKRARIKAGHCTACGKCEELCRFEAIRFDGPGNGKVAKTFRVDALACEGCGVCTWFCAEEAIEFVPTVGGEWFISETRCGPMVHAKLGIAESNSGKLVSIVRQNARRLAEERGHDLVIIDGSPGVGCPVIASITGASLVLAVTEPTPSGLHDLTRVVQLTRHFGAPVIVCVNKWDLNPQMSDAIDAFCREQSIPVAGRIRYDRAFTRAQIQSRTVVEASNDGVAEDIRSLWNVVHTKLGAPSRKEHSGHGTPGIAHGVVEAPE
ncbi:MAG TPA: ATP-binding protein [Phycisphaerae bacterium]|nr:ATP-binding protein [Phycisphaerae bacterium]HOM53774.1 ATP-binding protein [Phycisphaerae bacterium]HON68335.1 ATP-binding protein [Phycisphaerae bacterium]HPP29191.1 ATP-binding protein [Phycisphaerae bacterium]HPZ96963.1 ATP-binding protein [Phycisphaerae bacterium]